MQPFPACPLLWWGDELLSTFISCCDRECFSVTDFILLWTPILDFNVIAVRLVGVMKVTFKWKWSSTSHKHFDFLTLFSRCSSVRCGHSFQVLESKVGQIRSSAYYSWSYRFGSSYDCWVIKGSEGEPVVLRWGRRGNLTRAQLVSCFLNNTRREETKSW